MNLLGQKSISSREVAEMMEVSEHSKMLRKIDSINDILTKAKCGLSDYWYESSYKDSTGRKLREYQVTKKGCELIAHKTEGEKGVLFTVKYMERFEQIEQYIKDSYMIADPVARAKRWIEEQEEKNLLELENKEMKPLAEFGKALAKSETSILIRELAKIITQETKINVGERRLYAWLRENKYIMQNSTEPYQNRVEQGLFERNANGTRTDSDGVTRTNYTTYVTPKGQAYFISKFKKEDKQ